MPIGSAALESSNSDLESRLWQAPGVREHVWPCTRPMGQGVGGSVHVRVTVSVMVTSCQFSPTTILRARDEQVIESASAADPITPQEWNVPELENSRPSTAMSALYR